ncbi:DDB1- and CUL4-associated factor 8 [Orchesella cincta]|uniref:DDB1-and CUL4-associated factor 8 n=1 Tax=Orchesella cincta TaxID=48709 RepID=A0A1D2N8I3_ORCCI|nr:DDB1- and CUL4-associated factor 8 [Orchesella cincta]
MWVICERGECIAGRGFSAKDESVPESPSTSSGVQPTPPGENSVKMMAEVCSTNSSDQVRTEQSSTSEQNPNSVSDNSVGSATNSEFEIKRINSTNRNYRSSQVVDSSEDSNSNGLFSSGTSTERGPNICSILEREILTELPVDEESQNGVELVPVSGQEEEPNGEVEAHQNTNENQSDEDNGPAGQEDEEILSDSDSDSSSLHLMDDDGNEQESTSESSDFILEDLEDPSAVRGRAETEPESNNEAQETAAKKKKMSSKSNQDLPQVLKKPKPKHSWNGPRELLNRELGYSSKMQPQTAEVFRSRFYGSLFSAERLELMKKLDGHNGCVNCLNFNYAGTKLASGSDDLTIKIWNYGLGKLLTSFQSGHRANVFQAKFLPLVGLDNMIVSCGRDNQVRLTELDETGEVASSRKLAQHKGPAHKLSVHPENPQVILSCGEDSVVYSIDIREEKPQRLLSVKEKSRKVALYSIHSNPLASYEFCVSGRDEYVRVYDARKLSTSTTSPSSSSADSSPGESSSPIVRRFCPQHLVDSRAKAHVTAAVYSYNGKEILGSYNDENIYLFDSSHSDMADCTKVYEGHRNSATVKGVNFFGDKSQFVISGSDCGHVFIWDKETESIVNFFRGDENGVVNCLEPHPGAPILATSGLDDDVKIWIPSNEKQPKMGDLTATVRRNLKKRQEDLDDHALDGHMMWALLNHMRQAERQRRRDAGGNVSGSSSDDDDDDDDNEDGEADFHYRSNDCRIA